MVTKNIKHKGFTIVELLIVIVVIGILAAITIVSYSGISTRATASQNLANTNAVIKAAEAVRGDTTATGGGFYPAPSSTVATMITNLSGGSAKVPAGISVTGKYSADTTGTLPTATNNAILYVANGTAVATNTTGICVYYYDNNSTSVKSILSGAATTAATNPATATAATCT